MPDPIEGEGRAKPAEPETELQREAREAAAEAVEAALRRKEARGRAKAGAAELMVEPILEAGRKKTRPPTTPEERAELEEMRATDMALEITEPTRAEGRKKTGPPTMPEEKMEKRAAAEIGAMTEKVRQAGRTQSRVREFEREEKRRKAAAAKETTPEVLPKPRGLRAFLRELLGGQ